MVFVHMSELGNRFEKLPRHRPADQRWVFGIYESAINSKDFSIYDGYFNLTSTYSYRSDFPTYEIYGRRLDLFYNDSYDFSEGKKKLAFALISNCDRIYTSSRRLEYIKELNRYVSVEIYGKCGIKCASENCRELLYKKYKFVLAFENSICEDYVSEKFFLPLKYKVVPIVMGGANYSEFVSN
jgi:alpha-1,3-fucosyltransferase